MAKNEISSIVLTTIYNDLKDDQFFPETLKNADTHTRKKKEPTLKITFLSAPNNI